MKISLNWIKDFVDLDSKLEPQKLADLVTTRTAEIEGVFDQKKGFDGVVVGEIVEIRKHPDADKLNVAKVDIGKKEPIQLIFGQMVEMEVGFKVPVAVAPTKLPTGMEIEKKKLRGVLSEGMLCLDQELGLKAEGVSIQFFDKKVKNGTKFAGTLGLDDIVFEVDNKSLTHRPDLWGHYGMAREIAAITGKPLKKLDPDVKFPSKGESPAIEIQDYDLCPRYCGVIIKNIKVEDSPQWLKDRLTAVGYRPISNIVDVTNYVMAELGQPLHAFDKNFIKKGIVVRRAKKDETITTLDNQKRKLDANMLVIADHEKPVAIAGVMGGENSEINDGTTEIIIESANFNPESVRTTSTRLGLRTEAVQRFEKSLDPALAETAIKRTCELILKLCPDAQIAGPITDVKKTKITKPKIDLSVKAVSSKMGVPVTQKQCMDILTTLEFEVTKKSDDILQVTVPTFRATKDVDIADDLVEEIVRMYGYENIPAELPDLPIRVPIPNKERTLKHKAREILSGMGLSEVYTYTFYGKDIIKNALLSDSKFKNQHLQIENPLSNDQTHLRISLVPNLLKAIRENLRFSDSFRIFEVGRTFIEEGKYFPTEEKWICGASVMPQKSKEQPFYGAKAVCMEFLNTFSKKKVSVQKPKDEMPYMHPSRAADVIVDGGIVGKIFEVHPVVLKNYDIEAHVAMFELNFTRLSEFEEPTVKYAPIPKFPGLDIDISVLVSRKTTVKEVEKAIFQASEKLIKRVKLFDIYQGENIEKDRKALAFRILLQADDRTLTDEEMAKVQKKIFANLKDIGGIVRGI